jgi:hypothetical protein
MYGALYNNIKKNPNRPD